MSDWPLVGGGRVETVGQDTSSSTGTSVSCGSANNKGSWTQIIAATAFDAVGLLVFVYNDFPGDYLIDVGIGMSGSEQTIISNIYVGFRSLKTISIQLPIGIPAGTRIAARVQSAAGYDHVILSAMLISRGFLPGSPLSRVDTYGASPSTSRGTSVDPGGMANTKGSYSQLTSSTDHEIRALLLCAGWGGDQTRDESYWLMDIAVGGAGSEQVIVPDIMLSCSATVDEIQPNIMGPIPVTIPAGSRIAARVQCSITDIANRLFDLVIYGVG